MVIRLEVGPFDSGLGSWVRSGHPKNSTSHLLSVLSPNRGRLDGGDLKLTT
jgi:hypothetical protein